MLVISNITKEKYERSAQNCPVRDANGALILIAVQKSGVSAREKPRKHRMQPRRLCADQCEYYERCCTMSKEYDASRQPAGLFCSVTDTNNRFSSDV